VSSSGVDVVVEDDTPKVSNSPSSEQIDRFEEFDPFEVFTHAR